MTDRELLEFAAKAAGIDGRYRSGSKDIYQGIETGCGYTLDAWRPLDDDGDALRLAVKLMLLIDCEYNRGVGVGSASYEEVWEDKTTDPYAAARRAIVRAAAEIGKGMK